MFFRQKRSGDHVYLQIVVLHRLFDSGSDRSCVLLWKKDYAIPGIGAVNLHLESL